MEFLPSLKIIYLLIKKFKVIKMQKIIVTIWSRRTYFPQEILSSELGHFFAKPIIIRKYQVFYCEYRFVINIFKFWIQVHQTFSGIHKAALLHKDVNRKPAARSTVNSQYFTASSHATFYLILVLFHFFCYTLLYFFRQKVYTIIIINNTVIVFNK